MERNVKGGAAVESGKRARAVCIACRRVECGCVTARGRLAELRRDGLVVDMDDWDSRPVFTEADLDRYLGRKVVVK